MAKHALRKQTAQLVIQANQFFKKTYDIHSLYKIKYFFNKTDCFTVFCNALPEVDLGVFYTFDINQNLYNHLITTGKNAVACGKDNLEYLKKLQKYRAPIQFSRYGSYQILIAIYNIDFHIDMFIDNFKEIFYQNLLLVIAKDISSNSASKYREDEDYQAFVQFAMPDINQFIDPDFIEYVTPSFSKETMKMYQAISTLYDLKDACLL